MCGHKRELQTAAAGYPADGETVRLTDLPRAEGRSCRAGFPWWTLWMLWPLFWLVKGGFFLAAPVIAWLGQPLAFTITPLPLILVGAGIALIVLGALRRGRQ